MQYYNKTETAAYTTYISEYLALEPNVIVTDDEKVADILDIEEKEKEEEEGEEEEEDEEHETIKHNMHNNEEDEEEESENYFLSKKVKRGNN